MTGISRRTLGKTGVAVAAAALLPAATMPVYRDPTVHVAVRVADLLRRMTIAEKVGQLMAVGDKVGIEDAAGGFDPAKARAMFPDGIGHVCSPSLSNIGKPGVDATRTAAETAQWMNAVQRWAVEQTRLGIPVLAHEEALHGLARRDATCFPQAIGLASSWDPDLVTRVFAHAAAETRARGVHLVLTPVVDVARDPRWGRCEETYGEDTHLCSEMGVAAIRGFQGASGHGFGPASVFATVKHFAGHGASEGGDNTAPLVGGGERTFREQLLPPYRAAVERGHAAAVMPTYHEIDGVPMLANRRLVTGILRGEWGFAGMTVADYGGIRELRSIHHVAATDADAAALAMNAGVDVELPDPQTYVHLPALVTAGRVSLARIDEAVARVLTIKFDAGLFDAPYVDAALAETRTGTAAGRALAREAAGRTIVLLKNERATLPLAAERVGRLAVLGVSASDTPIGGYSDVPRQVVSVLDGLKAEARGRFAVDYAVGVRLSATRNWYGDAVIPPTPAEARALRDEALAVAARADHILLVLGDNEETAREAWSREHMGDRASLDLWGEQEALAEAVLTLGKPVIVLLLNGRPPSIPFIADRANAIIEGWYLGQETGLAVADVLFGRVNPGGKLPISIPRSVGQLPSYYSVKPSARRGYLDSPTEPLWVFGHGLSYTRFEMSSPRLPPGGARAGDDVVVEVDVTNTGDRAGDEVVQVYVHPIVSSVTEPVRALKGFKRLTLAPGERRTVPVTLRADAFAIWNLDMREVVEPGDFVIEAGPNLRDLKSATLKMRA